MRTSTNSIKSLKINDRGMMVQIKQPSLNALASLVLCVIGKFRETQKELDITRHHQI